MRRELDYHLDKEVWMLVFTNINLQCDKLNKTEEFTDKSSFE